MDARRGAHIAEEYRLLHLVRLDVFAAGQYVFLARGTPACASAGIPTILVACEGVGGQTFGGIGGGTVTFGRYGGAVEFSRAGEVTGQEQQRFGRPTLTATLRQTATAFLFRYGPASDSRFRVVATAGFAKLAATQTSDVFANGRTFQTTGMANVVGADLALAAGRVRLLVPIRLTYVPSTFFHYYFGDDGRWNVGLGFGVAVPVARAVIQ